MLTCLCETTRSQGQHIAEIVLKVGVINQSINQQGEFEDSTGVIRIRNQGTENTNRMKKDRY